MKKSALSFAGVAARVVGFAATAAAEEELGWTINDSKVITEDMTAEETAAGLKPWILKGSGSWTGSALSVDSVTQVGSHTTLDLRKPIKRLNGTVVSIKSGYKSDVFSGKTTIEKVILPDNMAFSGTCKQLFLNCTGIKEITPMFPDGMTWMPARTVEGCTALEGDAVLNNVSSVGIWAFSKTKIGSVVMGPKCNSIGYDAFDGCTTLSNVVINATNGWSTSSATGLMFNGCTALKNFTMMTFPTTIYSTDFKSHTAKATYAANKYKIKFLVPQGVEDKGGLLTDGITPWAECDQAAKDAYAARWPGEPAPLGVIKDTQASGASCHYGTYNLPAYQFVAYIPKPGLMVIVR